MSHVTASWSQTREFTDEKYHSSHKQLETILISRTPDDGEHFTMLNTWSYYMTDSLFINTSDTIAIMCRGACRGSYMQGKIRNKTKIILLSLLMNPSDKSSGKNMSLRMLTSLLVCVCADSFFF